MAVPRLVLAFVSCLLLAATAAATPETNEAAGERIAAAFNAYDADALYAMIDVPALGRRAFADLGFSRGQQADALRGLEQALPGRIRGIVADVAARNGAARRVKSTPVATGSLQLVRVISFEGDDDYAGADYLEFELDAAGRIVDWFSHAAATRSSMALREGMLSMVRAPGTVARLLGGGPRVDPEALESVQRFSARVRENDHAGAWQAMAQLPADFRATPEWAGMRLSLASRIGGAAYATSLREINARFADNPRFAFALIDYHLEREDYAAAVRQVDRFARTVVEDGLTHFLRCQALLELEDYAPARRHCTRTTELDPNFDDGWWTLATVGLQARDAPLVLATLSGIETHFDLAFDPDALVATAVYAWLADTPEFAAWAAPRRDAEQD